MIKMKPVINGIRDLQKNLNAQTKSQKKALETAIKIEGFRQLRQLRDDISKGRPGGLPYVEELSELARRTKAGRLKKRQVPLYRLSRLVRYNVEYKNGDIRLSFGFVKKRGTMSTSWKKLILKHAKGADVLYTGSRTELGRRFARIGGKLKKQDDPDAKYFFLRKTTGRRIDLPKRDIIDPFWNTNEADAMTNIRKNWRRKMRGETI